MTKIILFLFLTVLLTGCVSNAEGKSIKADIKELDAKYEILKVSVQDNKNTLDRSIKKIDVKLAELDVTLKQAKTLLAQNNANFGQDMLKIEEDVQKLSGKNEEILNKFELITKNFEQLKYEYSELKAYVEFSTKETQEDIKKDEKIAKKEDSNQKNNKKDEKTDETDYKTITDSKKLFDFAYKHVETKKYDKAIEIYEYFITKFPKDKQLESAYYWITQNYYAKGDYKNSFIKINDFLGKYPKSSHIPQVLFQMGICGKQLKIAKKDIQDIFNEIIKRYSKSPYAAKAKKELDTIK